MIMDKTHWFGAKKKVVSRVLRLFLRHARTGNYAASQLKHCSAPMITFRRIQQLLPEDPYLTFLRAYSAPALAHFHKLAIVEWGGKMIVKDEHWWLKIFFSGESRFTSDSHNVLSIYWSDSGYPVRRLATWCNRGDVVGLFFVLWPV